MDSRELYLQIVFSLADRPRGGEALTVTMDRLAEVLYCTKRNVRLILRKLEEERRISWKAGKGRGNASRITLLDDPEEIAADYLADLLARERMKEAIQFVRDTAFPQALRNRLRMQLEQGFGLQVQHTSTRSLDVLRIPRYRAFSSLDPIRVATTTEAFLLGQLCNRLVAFDGKKRTFRPELARAWEVGDEGRRWTFYLHKGVRFHHGRTLTARDVVHTVERVGREDSPTRWQCADIDRVVEEGEWTVTFYLLRPNAFMLNFLANITMSVLPHDVAFSDKAMMGTGPFQMAEHSEQVLIITAFDFYFRERAFLDRVEFWQVPESSDIEERSYLLIDADVPGNEGEAGVEVEAGEIEYEMKGGRYLLFNFRKNGIQQHPAFRQAMRVLYDPVALLRDLKGNRVMPSSRFFPKLSALTQFREAELSDAARLLRESGYNGEPLKLYTFEKSEKVSDAYWLAQRCREVGLHIDVHLFPVAEADDPKIDLEANLLLMEEVLECDTDWGMLRLFRDPTTFVHRFLNESQLEQLEKEMAQYVAAADENDRASILERIERILSEERWLLHGYHAIKRSRVPSALRGLSLEEYGWFDLSKLWIKP